MEGVVIGRLVGWTTVVALGLLFCGCASRGTQVSVRAPAVEPWPQRVDLNRASPEPASTAPPIQQAAATTPVNSEAAKATESAKVPAGPPPSLAEVVAKAEAFYAKTPNYTCKITRQERLGATLQPTEKILLHFRTQPRSVYYRWVGDVCAGRECIWVENANDGKIVTKGGKSDFGMTGRRVSVAPDSFLAKSRARYTINNSGQDVLIAKLRKTLGECERGTLPSETLRYVGLEKPPEGELPPMHHVVETLPAGAPLFPKGGVRDFYFDPETGRVVLVEAKDAAGERQEYYYFEHLFANNTLTAADFDPDVMFARKPADPPK